MRKTFIKVEYTARRGEPYKLTHVEHYTQRQEERVNQLNEDDLIDIDDTLQISALRKVSTYTYIIILAFKENHNLFNILTLSEEEFLKRTAPEIFMTLNEIAAKLGIDVSKLKIVK